MWPGTLLVDGSTIDMASAREIQINGAEVAGNLTLEYEGNTADFAQVRSVPEAMGRKILHCDATGAGQAVKICNNMILVSMTPAAPCAQVLRYYV